MTDQKNKKSGFIISVELLLITTILVIGLIVGLVPVRNAVIAELADTSVVIDSIDHSFTYEGISFAGTSAGSVQGSSYVDTVDDTVFQTTLDAPAIPIADPTVL